MNINLHGIIPRIPTPFDVARSPTTNWRRMFADSARRASTVCSSWAPTASTCTCPRPKSGRWSRRSWRLPRGHRGAGGFGLRIDRRDDSADSGLCRLGAHAALVVTPAYYGDKMSAAALEAHFTAVADASPIPVLLYDVTKYTHISLALDPVLRLAAHPNIVGIKDSSGNVAHLGELIAAHPPNSRSWWGPPGLCIRR